MKITFTNSTILVLNLSFIIAISSAGYAQTYIPVQINQSPCTGITENKNTLSMKIFPNPNNGTLTLSIEVQHEIKQLNI